MPKEIKKLTDAELDIMLAIWKADGPVQRGYLDEEMREPHNWAGTTILTILSKLTDKGFLSCEKAGKSNVYTAIISESEYRALVSRTHLRRFYDSSVKQLVSAMFDSDDISESDLEELQDFLDSRTGRRGK